MKVPKVTSIVLVILSTLTLLNFILKYYSYFVLILSSSKNTTDEVNAIVQETGEVPHPHELFVPLLTFIPTRSPVLTRPWVLVTSSFVEENFLGLAVSFILFFYLGKYLETIWGSKEFTKFLVCNVVVPNVSLYVYYTVKSICRLESVPPVILTAMAINMGLFVAIKQRISNHYVLFFKSRVRIKVAYFPLILLVVCFVLLLISDEFYISHLLSMMGFITSWTYLRFYKSGTNERQSYMLPFATKRRVKGAKYKHKHTIEEINKSSTSLHLDSTPLKGDRSEQFSFYTFFPSPLSYVVKIISSLIFETLVHYRFLNKKDFAEHDDEDVADQWMFDELNPLQSKLFGLSPLKGAGDISSLPNAGSSIKRAWNWVMSQRPAKGLGIKHSMDKRRKLALKELE